MTFLERKSVVGLPTTYQAIQCHSFIQCCSRYGRFT